jgi:hypothetical protein
MIRTLTLTALMVIAAGLAAAKAEAGPWRNRRYQTSQPAAQARVVTPGSSANGFARANVWPYYSSSAGNPVGAAYSPAAGLRQGQWFGTFGLRPADARARGAY